MNGTGQAAGDLRDVSAKAGVPSDIDVDGVGGLVALLFGKDGLELKKRSEKFVRILKRSKSEYPRGIDFVEDRDFAVQAESPENESSSRFPIWV